MQLVLASTSLYRRELLNRLQLTFKTISPNVDEKTLPNETPFATANRLAQAKAKSVASQFPHALIIGSDQVAELEGKILGKPGNYENAVQQLRLMRGKTTTFHTALCLLNSATNKMQTRVIPCAVTLRKLSNQAIENYLRREKPFDCAGSAKAEGLGIALIEKIQCDDSTALIGLPLITLVSMLKNEGVDVLGNE